MVDLLITVVNYRTPLDLITFLDSIETFMPKNCSFVVSVQDVDPLIDISFKKYPFEFFYDSHDENIGYARACNFSAAKYPNAKYYGFFNADTKFSNSVCLDYCVDFLDKNPQAGIVGPLQYDSKYQITHAGIFGDWQNLQHRGWRHVGFQGLEKDQQCTTVSGSAYFVRRETWDELYRCGQFRSVAPEATGAFLPTQHFYEETWISWHATRHDWEIWYLGGAKMIHEWHKASPVGSQSSVLFESRDYFELAVSSHE